MIFYVSTYVILGGQGMPKRWCQRFSWRAARSVWCPMGNSCWSPIPGVSLFGGLWRGVLWIDRHQESYQRYHLKAITKRKPLLKSNNFIITISLLILGEFYDIFDACFWGLDLAGLVVVPRKRVGSRRCGQKWLRRWETVAETARHEIRLCHWCQPWAANHQDITRLSQVQIVRTWYCIWLWVCLQDLTVDPAVITAGDLQGWGASSAFGKVSGEL